MKKKLLIAFGFIAVIIIGGVIYFNIQLNTVVNAVKVEMDAWSEPDLATINDGVYNGSFGSMPVAVNLDVTVKDHKISSITMRKQTSGKGYEATGIMSRIIDSQKVKVDVITGATLSSRCIMIATCKALNSVK